MLRKCPRNVSSSQPRIILVHSTCPSSVGCGLHYATFMPELKLRETFVGNIVIPVPGGPYMLWPHGDLKVSACVFTCYFHSYSIHHVSHMARPEGNEAKILNPLQGRHNRYLRVPYQGRQTWNIRGEVVYCLKIFQHKVLSSLLCH